MLVAFIPCQVSIQFHRTIPASVARQPLEAELCKHNDCGFSEIHSACLFQDIFCHCCFQAKA